MKVAIIGTGFGKRVVAPVYAQLGFEVQVISPRARDEIEAACVSDVDLVSVHSPPFLHFEHVTLALNHKRAVLCDKPFGRDLNEALAMRDHAERAGVLNFLNFEFRCQPSRVRLKELLDDGAIGQLRHVSWTFIGSGLRHQKHRWLFDADSAGGWIGAYGSHAIDTLRWLFESEVASCGGLTRIETRIRLDRDGFERLSSAEDAFTAWFVMANSGSVSFDTAYSTPINLPHRLVLLGSEGALELVDENMIIIRRPGASPETVEFPVPTGDPHDAGLIPWLTSVRHAIREGRQIAPSFADGVAVAKAIQELRTTLKPVAEQIRS